MTKITIRNGFYSPLLAAAIFFGASAPGYAQTSGSPDNAVSPRYELGVFGGAQFWALQHKGDNAPNKLVGGGVFGQRFDIDFTPHFGMEESWSIFAVNNLRTTTTPGTPVTSVAFGARNGQVYLGPMLYLTRPESRIRPFVTIGPAFQYFWPTSNATSLAQSPAYSQFHTNYIGKSSNAALVWGGGVKFALSKRFVFRLDARGTWTQNPHFGLLGLPTGPGSVYIPSGGTQLGSQVTAGIGFRFGYKEPVAPPAPAPPPPPPANRDFSVSLNASPSQVCVGESVTITPTATGGVSPNYSWTVNGQTVSSGTSYQFTPQATTTLSVTASAEKYNPATATTTVTVKPYVAPNGSVSASPTSITVGQTSTLNSTFDGQCGGSIRPATFTASEGTINGNTFDSSNVQFDPSNNDEQNKTVTITASAADDKGTGTATTTITVRKPANPKAVRLQDLLFAPGQSRVNNCGKRLLLEQLKTYTDKDPTGRVVFVGHMTDREKRISHLDRQRALNAAAVISAGKGICSNFSPTQILIDEQGVKQNGVDYQPFFCGTSTSPMTKERGGSAITSKDTAAQYRRVEIWWVPTNAQLPPTVTNAKDATTYSVQKLGCPR
ncbi:MAG: hypothetical protein JWO80_4048 [Bryobacterales bacterium]|nr:hypothetical protein [Bryobacterales bacterium]